MHGDRDILSPNFADPELMLYERWYRQCSIQV